MPTSSIKKFVATGLAALTIGGTVIASSAPAQAGYYGGYGYHQGGYYGGYRPYYRRNNGGAIAAGLIGGLAVGALAATAARPAYSYGYPAYGYGQPVTYGYGYPAYGSEECYIVRRKFVNPWGDLVIRREKVCE